MSTADIDLVLSRLEGVRKEGTGWMARCPVHDDRSPSLHVWEDNEGRIAYHCFAGCDHARVREALGLADERRDDDYPSVYKPRGSSVALPIVAKYRYTDEQGRWLYTVGRTATDPSGTKHFPTWRPDPAGPSRVIWGLAKTRRVLYRLSDLVEAAACGFPMPVYVCEGEKDVESIEDAGGLATCNPHGAGKWRDEYSEYLRGADVIVIADADEPGRAHAQTVARSLAGVARSVRVVEAAVGKDASDHLAAGHTLDDFLAVDAGPVGPEDGGSEETEQAVPPLEGRTDTGNANRFIRIFGERVRYCDLEGRWYVYDGCRWAPDEKLLVAEWMRQALLTIFEDATRAADDTEARALAKWGTHSLSSAARKAALECAKSDPRVAVHPSEFDRGPYLLNCPNGTLDLKTRELRPHDPGDLLRKVTGAPYDPGARSELWERVVMEATGSDDDFRAALQRAFGYSATGDTREESFFIMAGGTQTGKSTVCLAVEMALGDYAASVSPDTWLERNQIGGTRDDLLRLDGVRMAVSAEAGRHSRMATAMMKAFTGGDAITVRGVYQRDRELRPVTKPWIHTNDVPTMPDDDQAIWRRAVIFPFEYRPAHPDPHVKATLCDPELSGAAVLAWIVAGCFEWQERGLDIPDVVRLATDTVRLRMDPLVDFFAECCEFEADVWTSTADLREAYMKWRRDYPHMRAISPKEWGQRLTARGLEKSKRNGVRGWLGVRLTNAAYTERTLPRG